MEELKEEQNMTDNENVPLVKKKRVINAPRSEKQIEAFKKAQQKKDENREKMKKEKEVKMAQIYFENKLKQENPEWYTKTDVWSLGATIFYILKHFTAHDQISSKKIEDYLDIKFLVKCNLCNVLKYKFLI